MMKTMQQRGNLGSAFAVTGLALALSGCLGGGGSDNSNNSNGGGGDNPDPETFETVEATTQRTSDGGLSFSEATNADTTGTYGSLGAECGDSPSDRYFETSEAIVFGDGNASDEQLQRLANAIHHYYPKTLETFGLDKTTFDKTNRAAISHRFLNRWSLEDYHAGDWSYLNNALGSVTSSKSVNITDATTANIELLRLNATDLKAVIEQTLANSNADSGNGNPDLSIGQFMQIESESSDTPTHQPRYTDEAKIVACADTSNEPGNGSAKTWGITVAGDFKGEIVHHELVHYVQERLFGGRSLSSNVPRWFREGQAVVIAGQPLVGKSRIDEYNPTTVEDYNDADDSFRSLDNYYGFYGLAYSYVNQSTPQEDINRMLAESYVSDDQIDANGNDSFYKFKDRFDALAVTPDDTDLTYSEYQNKWESLISDHL